MRTEHNELGSSTDEQALLRPVALWAADCAEKSLSIFEERYPNNATLRDAIDAGRAYGNGKPRDKNLRVIAMAAFKLGRDVDEASKYVTKAAQLTAAVAYTHTDLQIGIQGVRQAKHILGPAVYAALALEAAAGGDRAVSEEAIRYAIDSAPQEVHRIVMHLPAQPEKTSRADMLFYTLDSALRSV